jgi:hypothetical protein
MSSTVVTPITKEDVPDVGRFLHENLNRKISAEAWASSLLHRWIDAPPNHGAKLVSGERIVGVCCALYSEQVIEGQVERFCNPHSWCVLDEFRNSSINLVLYIVKQKGWHFSMLTPNPKVEQIFRHLGFKDLPKELLYLPYVPSLTAMSNRSIIETSPSQMAKVLSQAAAKEFSDHQSIPWLRSVTIGVPGDTCVVFYKPTRQKKMPGARILGLTDRHAFARHHGLLRHHLMVAEHLVFSRIEKRYVDSEIGLSWQGTRSEAKLFMSKSLAPRHFRDMYTELMALDI